MINAPCPAGDLTLGHVPEAAGVTDPKSVIALRHAVRPNDPGRCET